MPQGVRVQVPPRAYKDVFVNNRGAYAARRGAGFPPKADQPMADKSLLAHFKII